MSFAATEIGQICELNLVKFVRWQWTEPTQGEGGDGA
jgi:hypothetical protein